MKRTKIEQETCVTFNAEQDFALVGTCHPVTLRKMAKLNPEVHRKDGEWITYKVPKNWIKISPPRKLNMSEEQKNAIRERFKRSKT